jgi:hypothetical protein
MKIFTLLSIVLVTCSACEDNVIVSPLPATGGDDLPPPPLHIGRVISLEFAPAGPGEFVAPVPMQIGDRFVVAHVDVALRDGVTDATVEAHFVDGSGQGSVTQGVVVMGPSGQISLRISAPHRDTAGAEIFAHVSGLHGVVPAEAIILGRVAIESDEAR